jgi:flagellar basal-body rod protein FlgB
MTDAITGALNYALDGLSDRRKVSANNISNIQTPGFLAGETDFESELRKAINGRDSISSTPNHSKSLAPTRTDGNNVDLDNETVTAADTALKYQAMIEAMNSKFRIIRNAIGS